MTASGLPTGLVLDERFEAHDTGPGHPERPARLQTLRAAFDSAGLAARCVPIAPRDATDEEILAVHTRVYLDRLREQCAAGAGHIDALDSAICPASYEIARWAVGAVLEAAERVASGALSNAFCAVRPPGHHCERGYSMGFCLLGNVAIAARWLRARYGFNRIAIVDWDVHHGNGTQHVFEDTSEVFYCSLHGHPAYLYPGTGFENERGTGDGAGATLNLAFYPGSADDDYRRAFDERILPALEDYQPEFVLVSAGFDAHRRDPLAPINLESASFAWMTRAVLDIAERYAGGKVVSVLEGGYDLEALADSATRHLRVLMGDSDVPRAEDTPRSPLS